MAVYNTRSFIHNNLTALFSGSGRTIVGTKDDQGILLQAQAIQLIKDLSNPVIGMS